MKKIITSHINLMLKINVLGSMFVKTVQINILNLRKFLKNPFSYKNPYIRTNYHVFLVVNYKYLVLDMLHFDNKFLLLNDTRLKINILIFNGTK